MGTCLPTAFPMHLSARCFEGGFSKQDTCKICCGGNLFGL